MTVFTFLYTFMPFFNIVFIKRFTKSSVIEVYHLKKNCILEKKL